MYITPMWRISASCSLIRMPCLRLRVILNVSQVISEFCWNDEHSATSLPGPLGLWTANPIGTLRFIIFPATFPVALLFNLKFFMSKDITTWYFWRIEDVSRSRIWQMWAVDRTIFSELFSLNNLNRFGKLQNIIVIYIRVHICKFEH